MTTENPISMSEVEKDSTSYRTSLAVLLYEVRAPDARLRIHSKPGPICSLENDVVCTSNVSHSVGRKTTSVIPLCDCVTERLTSTSLVASPQEATPVT